MNEFIQLIFSGLTLGFVYSLIGFSYGIFYQAKKVINFSGGEFVMLGGISSVIIFEKTGSLIAAFLLSSIVAIVFGVILKFLFSLTKRPDSLSLIVLTIGYALFMRGLVEIFIGKNIFSFPDFITNNEWNFYFYDAVFSFSAMVISLFALLTLGLVFFFLKYTKFGKATLAVCENEDISELMGIAVSKIHYLVFLGASLVGSISGILITYLSSIHYESGILLGLKGFIAAIIGGINRPYGAIFGGLVLGFGEAISSGYISTDYKDAVAFLLLIVILIFQPQGLFVKRAS